jgi:hypothetical protein
MHTLRTINEANHAIGAATGVTADATSGRRSVAGLAERRSGGAHDWRLGAHVNPAAAAHASCRPGDRCLVGRRAPRAELVPPRLRRVVRAGAEIVEELVRHGGHDRRVAAGSRRREAQGRS